MVNSIAFDNFRGLKHMELSSLSRITLITGRNNAGKSSVLEGIFTILNGTSVNSFLSIRGLRGLPPFSDVKQLWEPVFYNMDTRNPVLLSISVNGKNYNLTFFRDDTVSPNDIVITNEKQDSRTLGFMDNAYALKYRFSNGNDVVEEGHFYSIKPGEITKSQHPNNSSVSVELLSCMLLKATGPFQLTGIQLTEWYGKIELRDKQQDIIDSLRIVEPGIQAIKTIVQEGRPRLFVKTESSFLPLELAGDGLCRLLYFVLAIMQYSDSLVLIDEIENGFHYSMQKDFWKIIASAARENNCQIIATTHSYECIQNAVDGIGEAGMEDEFCLYRVEHEDGENRAFRLNGELTRFSIDRNMEVR